MRVRAGTFQSADDGTVEFVAGTGITVSGSDSVGDAAVTVALAVPVVRGFTATVADGGTITHGLGTTPTVVTVSGSVASSIVTVTSIGATTFTVAIKKDDGTAGTTQTVYWSAS